MPPNIASNFIELEDVEPTYIKPLFMYKIKAVNENISRAYDAQKEFHSCKFLVFSFIWTIAAYLSQTQKYKK